MSCPERKSRPDWFKVRLPQDERFKKMDTIVKSHRLNTVCESAACPNRGECWSAGTATFMILGNICTRACKYCDVITGRPKVLDLEEPQRVADAIATMGVKFAVITSVTRDDLPDGGAELFAKTVTAIRMKNPNCGVEVLVPDFMGDPEANQKIFDVRPTVFGHNMETVPRIFIKVRPKATYNRSLQILKDAKDFGLKIKTGLMLGLGETRDELKSVFEILANMNLDVLTLGQYLRPSDWHVPVSRFLPPEEFQALGGLAKEMGIPLVHSGPLVRSSYHAEQILKMPATFQRQ
jgi:lipoyl synthase